MMTYDDRGEGGYEIMLSSIKEVFCSSIQILCLEGLAFQISNCAWNFFQKEHHIAYVVVKKYTLNEGGFSKK